MSKEIREELWFNEMLVKIETYEGMYYTIGKHTKEEILNRKKEWEKDSTNSFTYTEIMDSFIGEDLSYVMGINQIEISAGKKSCEDSGLIYLAYEHKILNRKEIKESLIQFN